MVNRGEEPEVKVVLDRSIGLADVCCSVCWCTQCAEDLEALSSTGGSCAIHDRNAGDRGLSA